MPGVRVITRDGEIHIFPQNDDRIRVSYQESMVIINNKDLNDIAFPIDTVKRVEAYDD